MGYKILIVGGGGREHALAWKISQSPRIEKIYCAPGNSGTASIGENIPINATDLDGITNFAREKNIDLVVVAQDDPLAMGLVDKLTETGIRTWGPTKAAAQIEASKAFAKKFMSDFNIPTAKFKVFNNYEDALSYVKSQGFPIVIKASGLALGKGVIICKTLEEAESALKKITVDKIFGDSGNEVIIEEFLEGQEISIHAFCDGSHYKLFPTAQDHKPIGEGDTGPNTGGIGAIAPVPWVTADMMADIDERVVKPAVEGLKSMGIPFVGVLFPGLKMTKSGPKVLEFNARFGDPETQSFVRLLKTDLIDIMEASIDGTLNEINIQWSNQSACTVVAASNGYPDKYEKGFAISGIEDAQKLDGIVIFHAGTGIKDGKLITSGGRVLGVSAVGETLKDALNKAYNALGLIKFDGMYYRKDIGRKSLNT